MILHHAKIMLWPVGRYLLKRKTGPNDAETLLNSSLNFFILLYTYNSNYYNNQLNYVSEEITDSVCKCIYTKLRKM